MMKYITLYQNVRRGNIESINRGGGEGNVALYSYSSLPEKYKKRWVERHGEPEKQMRQEMIRNIVKKDERAERFFEEYLYDKNGELVGLPEEGIQLERFGAERADGRVQTLEFIQ